MEYKRLSNTGLKLPAIGVGTYRYTGGIEPLRRALQLGSSLIDTAEGYRGAEKLVGKTIKGVRDEVFVSTKVWPTRFRYNDIIKAAEDSLKRLETDRIDLYQLHWPNPTVPIAETMQAMESLVDAGKVRFIGVSNFSVPQLKQAQASMTKHKIVSNQVSYSLIDRYIEKDLLPYCVANDILVMAYSPLGSGLGHIKAHDKQNALQKISDETGKTCAQIALNWCISNKNVVAIPKANSIGRIEENCGAAGWSLSPQQIELLENSMKSFRKVVKRILKRKMQWFLETAGIRTPMHEIEINIE